MKFDSRLHSCICILIKRKRIFRLTAAIVAELCLAGFIMIAWNASVLIFSASENTEREINLNNAEQTQESDLSSYVPKAESEWVIYDNEIFEEIFTKEGSDDAALPVAATTIRPSAWMITSGSLAVSNESEREFDIDSVLDKNYTLKIKKTDQPQVLILHTHGTESYNTGSLSRYYESDALRSTDIAENVVSIGSYIEGLLTEAGYTVIHDMTMHDDPDYNSSYASSRKAIKKYLEKYPSVKVILDVHRDTVITEEKIKYRPIWECDGRSAAQVMFLLGAGGSRFENSHWKENLSFALRICARAEEVYPDLMRPILMRSSLYNQDMSPGALLVEVGTCGNTKEEAMLGAEKFTECLTYVLDSYCGVD